MSPFTSGSGYRSTQRKAVSSVFPAARPLVSDSPLDVLSKLLCKKHILTPHVLSCRGCFEALLSSGHCYPAPQQVEAQGTPVWGTRPSLLSNSPDESRFHEHTSPPENRFLKVGFLGIHPHKTLPLWSSCLLPHPALGNLIYFWFHNLLNMQLSKYLVPSQDQAFETNPRQWLLPSDLGMKIAGLTARPVTARGQGWKDLMRNGERSVCCFISGRGHPDVRDITDKRWECAGVWVWLW